VRLLWGEMDEERRERPVKWLAVGQVPNSDDVFDDARGDSLPSSRCSPVTSALCRFLDAFAMAPTDSHPSNDDQITYLKGLLKQLTDKITDLEHKAKAAVVPTPAPQGARLILIGPPGAGQ